MKRASIAVVALLALTLTGCAGVADDAGNERSEPVATETAAPSAAPTTPETPEAAPTVSVASTPAEEAFLAVVVSDLAGEETTLTEQEALDAGHYACEQIAALPEGATIIDRYNIKPLPGLTDGANSVIVREAIANFCP